MATATLQRATHFSPIDAARSVALRATKHAQRRDDDGSFPDDDVAALSQNGLLSAPLPVAAGGCDLASAAKTLPHVLRILGAASLPLGRLYEGHVNAVALISRYGSNAQILGIAHQIRLGHLLGVWNTDDQRAPLRILGRGGHWYLVGRKILCSGAGAIMWPLLTARDPTGRLLMVVPRLVCELPR